MSGLSDRSIFSSSSRIRSLLIFWRFGASAEAALSVFPIDLIAQLRTEAERSHNAERVLRKALHRVSHRADQAAPRSCLPPKRSTSPLRGSYAIALIVKSLRCRSSARLGVNVTCLGCRPSS